jgi:phosphohistidine phosphatase
MDLYILRHGKAEEARHGQTDSHRKLTKKGHDDIITVANWMASQEISFDLIAASPYIRAQETAAIIANTLEIPEKRLTWKNLVPEGNPDSVCREINKHTDDKAILLVGHEPLLSALIGWIISGDDSTRVIMTKGALAKIRDFSFAQHPSGELNWLITAKQMAANRGLQ